MILQTFWRGLISLKSLSRTVYCGSNMILQFEPISFFISALLGYSLNHLITCDQGSWCFEAWRCGCWRICLTGAVKLHALGKLRFWLHIWFDHLVFSLQAEIENLNLQEQALDNQIRFHGIHLERVLRSCDSSTQQMLTFNKLFSEKRRKD